MRKATAARRLAVLKGVAVAGVLATAAVATGTASAQVFVIPGGTNGTTNGTALVNAITQANTNGGSNTIVIGNAAFAPTTALPAITDPNLTITGNHALQASGGQGPIISGVNFTSDSPFLTINAGAKVTLEGVDFRSAGAVAGASPAISDLGSLIVYNSAIQANSGSSSLTVGSGASATLSETLVSDNAGLGLDNESGTLQLNNDTIASNTGGGIVNNGTTNMTNTIVSNGTAGNCSLPMTASDHSVDTDGSCAATSDTTSKKGVSQTLGATGANGGPTVTETIPSTAGSTNPALGLGNPLTCALTDQRFFLHTSSGCDAGSYQHGGTQDTTPVSCPGPGVITQNGSGQNVSQQITVTDPLSGLGPEGGAIADLANAQQSPVVTLGNDQADVIDGVTITNGSVATSAFSSSGPSSSAIQVTATKSTLGTPTQWSFYSTNWAGVTKLCK